MRPPRTRRQFLRATSAGGLASVTLLAGCRGLGGDSATTDTPTADATEAQPADTPTGDTLAVYESWLPDPSAIQGTDHYFFFYTDYATLTASQSRLDAEVYSEYAESPLFDSLPLVTEEVTHAISRGSVRRRGVPVVLAVSISESTVTGRLTDSGFERHGDRGGFTVYRNDDRPRGNTVAVDGRTLVYGGPDDVSLFVDAHVGDVARYTVTDPDLAAVVDRLDTGTFVYGATVERMSAADANPSGGQFAGEVALGYADRIRGERTTSTLVYAFETAEDAETAAIDEYTSSDILSDYTTVSASRDGRVVTITGEVPTDELYTEVLGDS